MARKNAITPETAESAPNIKPRIKPKSQPRAEADSKPIRQPRAARNAMPKPQPINTPVVSPESIAEVITLHYLPHFEQDRRFDPHAEQIPAGTCPAASDVELEAAQSGYAGWFVARERKSNGTFGRVWTFKIADAEEVEIGETEEDAPSIDGPDTDELTPDMYRLSLENAELRATLRAQKQTGGASSIVEAIQAVKMLDDLRGQREPQKTLAEQIKEARELVSLVTPKPAPVAPAPQTEADPYAALLKATGIGPDELLRAALGIESKPEEPRGLLDKVSDGLMAMLPALAPTIGPGLNALMLKLAGAPATPTPTTTAHPEPAAPPPDAGQPEPITPEQQLWRFVAECCAESFPADQAAAQINAFVASHPELGDTVDDIAATSASGALLMLRAVAPQAAARPGAKDWLQALQSFLQLEESGEAPEQHAQWQVAASATAAGGM